MKNMLIAAALAFASTSATAMDVFVELDHYSMLNEIDYGMSTLNLGLNKDLTENFSVAARLGTPVSNYNDFARANGNNLEQGDLLIGLNMKYKLYKAAFIEVDHYSMAKEVDYGLTIVNLGTTYNFTDNLSITGKLGTPISAYNDFKQANGNDLAKGDVVGGAGVRFTF